MTAFPTDRLAELARKKLECLLELHKMGEKQLELVREDRITDLLDLLSAKQRLLLALAARPPSSAVGERARRGALAPKTWSSARSCSSRSSPERSKAKRN
jgi:hypothetical protein